MDLGPFWGRFGAFWGGFGGALGRFEVIWGHFGADLGGFGGSFHPITPSDPTEGALHARSLHPGHQWGRAGPHLHRPPLPYGRRGDQQVPFWGGRGAKKNPTNVGFGGGGLLILPLFPHFRLIFPVFHPVFSPFSSSGTSDRFTRILQHILTQRRYRLQPPNGAFLGQNGGISALSHRSPFSAFSYMRNSMGFQSCGG